MRVLGVDPGLTRCGIGVVDGEPGRALTMIGVGVICTPPGDDISQRLLALEVAIESWLTEHRPDAVAVERVFSQHNVRTVMGTAQAGAVAIVCAARRGLPVALHTPSEVKAAVTGNGRADKAQVTDMVTRLLRIDDPPRPADCADALALAICHLWRGPAQRRMNDAKARASQATSVMAARATAQVQAQLKAQAAAQRAAVAGRRTAASSGPAVRGTVAPGIAAVPGGPR